jgi:LysM repeat protein
MDGNMMAVDKNTGTEKWKVGYTDTDRSTMIKGSKSIILTSDKIVVENNNKLKFYNPTDGSLLKATLPLTIHSNVMGLYPIGVMENTLFLTDSNNLLYTFGLQVKDTVAPSGSFNLAPLSYLPSPDGSGRIRIPFTISEDAFVKINLVDEAGEVVQQFDLGRCKVGANEVSWDGKNMRGFTYAHGKYYPVLNLTDLSGNKATYQEQEKIILITDNYGLTTRNANLRKKAGTDSEIIRVVPSGSEVKIIAESGVWYQVEYRMPGNVQSGYISKSLIAALSNSQISQDQTGSTRQNVNVRTLSGTQNVVKTVIPANTNIKIIGSSGDWYMVEYQKNSTFSDTGYVAKYLIAVTTKSTVHVVQSGDTLWKIAQKYGTTVNMIIKLNNLDTNKYLYIGQKLTVTG